jgi:hypothetical protein
MAHIGRDDGLHLRNPAGGAAHVADVAGKRGSGKPVDKSRFVLDIRHPRHTWLLIRAMDWRFYSRSLAY